MAIFRRGPLIGAKLAIFEQYLAITARVSSVVSSFDGGVSYSIKAAATVYRADRRDEAPRISESWLWQQTSAGMPKRTEQNLILRIGKSEAKVSNNKRLRSKYCRPTVEANYRDIADKPTNVDSNCLLYPAPSFLFQFFENVIY